MKTFDDLYITSLDDMIQAVNDLGIVPFFSNSIPGFSIEEKLHGSARNGSPTSRTTAATDMTSMHASMMN